MIIPSPKKKIRCFSEHIGYYWIIYNYYFDFAPPEHDVVRLPFIVGLGLCVTGMCIDLRQQTQDCVRAVIEQISVALEMGSPDEADYQVRDI